MLTLVRQARNLVIFIFCLALSWLIVGSAVWTIAQFLAGNL